MHGNVDACNTIHHETSNTLFNKLDCYDKTIKTTEASWTTNSDSKKGRAWLLAVWKLKLDTNIPYKAVPEYLDLK